MSLKAILNENDENIEARFQSFERYLTEFKAYLRPVVENSEEGWKLVGDTIKNDRDSIFPKIREARIKAEESFLDRTKEYRKIKERKDAEASERREKKRSEELRLLLEQEKASMAAFEATVTGAK